MVGGDLLRDWETAFFAGVRPRARAGDFGDGETPRVRLTGRSLPVPPFTVSASVELRFSVAFTGLLAGAGDLLLAMPRTRTGELLLAIPRTRRESAVGLYVSVTCS